MDRVGGDAFWNGLGLGKLGGTDLRVGNLVGCLRQWGALKFDGLLVCGALHGNRVVVVGSEVVGESEPETSCGGVASREEASQLITLSIATAVGAELNCRVSSCPLDSNCYRVLIS